MPASETKGTETTYLVPVSSLNCSCQLVATGEVLPICNNCITCPGPHILLLLIQGSTPTAFLKVHLRKL